jgi:hypothetical protein
LRFISAVRGAKSVRQRHFIAKSNKKCCLAITNTLKQLIVFVPVNNVVVFHARKYYVNILNKEIVNSTTFKLTV